MATRFAGSNLHAADQPEHNNDDQHQAENAAESRPAIPVIAMIAAKPPSSRITRMTIRILPISRAVLFGGRRVEESNP